MRRPGIWAVWKSAIHVGPNSARPIIMIRMPARWRTTVVPTTSSMRRGDAFAHRIRRAWRLLPWLALFPTLAFSASPHGSANLWLFEQPEQAAPLYRARIAGTATYQNYTAHATLAFACRTDGGRVSMELVIDPKALGFDTNPYEGPDATAHGPIVVSDTAALSVKLKVGGWYGDGGAFNVGTPFVFGASSGDIDTIARHGLTDGGHGGAWPLKCPCPRAASPWQLRFAGRRMPPC